jgi:hypothetical protein
MEEWHIERLAAHSVSGRWTPVMLYRDDRFIGIGTSFRTSRGLERFITVGHIFDKPGRWSYRRLRPLSQHRYPIVRAGPIPGLEGYDVMICAPGEGSYPVLPRLSRFQIGVRHEGEAHGSRLERTVSITSLITGEQVECFALVKKDGTEHMLAAIPTIEGESGTGFVENSDKVLYVLRGTFLNAGQLEQFLPSKATEVGVFIRLIVS